jgi:hypothetical protein
VILAIDILSQYYDIGFVDKHNLGEHLLWSGTATVDAEEMQGGVAAQQKDFPRRHLLYILFIARDVLGGMGYDDKFHKGMASWFLWSVCLFSVGQLLSRVCVQSWITHPVMDTFLFRLVR